MFPGVCRRVPSYFEMIKDGLRWVAGRVDYETRRSDTLTTARPEDGMASLGLTRRYEPVFTNVLKIRTS